MAFSPGAFITRSQGLRVAMVEMVDMVEKRNPLWTIWSLTFNQLAGKKRRSHDYGGIVMLNL